MLTRERNVLLTSVEGDAPLARPMRETYWVQWSRVQALMEAYIQSFNILLVMCVVLIPFIFFFGRRRKKA